MTFKPPWSLPTTDGTDVGAPVMQAPPAVHLTIEASKGWLDTLGSAAQQVGDQIVDFYSSNISQFVQSQRRQNAIGGLEQSSRWMTVPGLDLNHVRSQGREIIRIIARPESAPRESFQINTDINLDGYIAWVRNWQNLPPPAVVNMAVDVVLNGYGLFPNFVTDNNFFQPFTPAQDPVARVGATVILVAAFGPTALRCASLQDDSTGHNPFTLNKDSGGPAPSVLPPRGVVKGDGTIPQHKDLLGYFVFNWGDQLNPDTWAYENSSGNPQGLSFSYGKNFPPATLVKIIQFKSVAESPLKALGQNLLYSQFTTFPPLSPAGQNGVDFLCAEFYNRSSLRSVAQSWKYSVNSSQAVLLANDKPLYYATDGGSPYSDIGAQRNLVLPFDLSSISKPANTATFGQTAPPPGPGSVPLTAAEQAVLAANNAAEAAQFAAYTAALIALNTAQNNFAIANSNIQSVGLGGGVGIGYAYAKDPSVSNLAALVAAFPDQSKRDALVTYCQASLAWQLNPDNQTRLAAFVAAENNGLIAAIVVDDFLVVIANENAIQFGLAYPTAHDKVIAAGGSEAAAAAAGHAAAAQAQSALSGSELALTNYITTQGRPDLATAGTNAVNALISAENAFIAAQALFNPQHILADNFLPIDGFNHRIITVANGVYSIGAYSGR